VKKLLFKLLALCVICVLAAFIGTLFFPENKAMFGTVYFMAGMILSDVFCIIDDFRRGKN